MKAKSFLLCLASALLAVGCYQITLIEQPHEATTNSTFSGKMVIKRDGTSNNGIVQHVYGLFGICVPTGWEADGDIIMTQVPQEGTDVGDDEYTVTITRRLEANEKYTSILNEKYPKTGYTWLGFATESDFKSLFNAEDSSCEVDSIYVEFSIKTDDQTGTFYLDYIAGQIDYDEIDNLVGDGSGGWNFRVATFDAPEVSTVTYCDTHITVTRPDGTMDDDTTSPVILSEWELELMENSTRAGAAYAYKDQKYNGLFTRYRGWNGGDGVLTVGLPDGNVFWTFNDSFYGVVDATDRSRGSSSFPRNSIMVQKASDGVPGETDKDLVWLADYVNWTRPHANRYFHCRTHLRHPDGEMTDEEIEEGEIDQTMVYWSGDGRIYDGKLQMLWFGTQAEELVATGTTIATYSLDGSMPEGYYLDTIPDYLPAEGDYLYMESVTHQINDNTVSFGSTLIEGEDGHNYLYGVNSYNVMVARTETEDLYSNWQYYVKTSEDADFEWTDTYPSDEEMELSSIMDDGETLNLPWVFKDGEWYYMVSQAPYFSREVYMYRSEDPWGPFGEKHLLFILPDSIDKLGDTAYHWLYMVNLHPALSREGELVFTTNTDAESFWDNFNDPGSADYYRPFFYRVFNWKSIFGEELTSTTQVALPTTTQRRYTDNYYYNLQGMRVTHPTKGIYIHNGKKVVLK